jgi:hypothetical protein
MSGRSSRFTPLKAGFPQQHVNADIYQELLRQDVVPWGRRTYPDGIRLFADSAQAYNSVMLYIYSGECIKKNGCRVICLK